MPKKLPKISIVTPTLNQADFIEQSIKSVLSQNYPNLEYIVIDGGSSDGTHAILKKYNDKLTWISGKDKGQSDAINKGLKLAKGEIVSYLNSDDVLEYGALFKTAEFFTQNPDIFWVTGKCRIIDSKGAKQRNFVTGYKNFCLRFLRLRNALLVLNFISQPATFWRREVVDEIGLFDDSYRFSMDYDYWLRIFRKYRLGFMDDYLASFRVHEGSKGNRNLSGQLNESYRIAAKFTSLKLLLTLHGWHDIISSYLYRNLYSLK